MKKEAAVTEMVEGLERFLALEPRSHVLDLGCGAGRGTLELARRGHRVLGVDADERALAEARAAAKGERLNVHFLKNDPRLIAYRAEFDAVVSLDSAFGRLETDRDDLKCLEAARKGLKPGGKLLLDLLNRERVLRHFEPNSWGQSQEGKGPVTLDRVHFDFEKGRLDNHRTIVGPKGERTPSFTSLRVYALTEVKALLERAGLRYERCWGGYDGSAYGMDSPRLIVLATAGPQAAPRRRETLPGDAIRIKGRRR
jgi:SAM-dependent methyltransferase